MNNNYGNFFTRNFQTAVLIWKYYHSFNEQLGIENISEYYQKKYSNEYIGYTVAIESLEELSNYCILADKRCVLAMMPDIHQMNPYGMEFIHEKMKNISNNLGLEYVDLLPSLREVESKLLWNQYYDPHPNSLGHSIIAHTLYNSIR